MRLTSNAGAPHAGSFSAILSADVNADGRLDLVTVDSTLNRISVLMGNGDGSDRRENYHQRETSFLDVGGRRGHPKSCAG